MPRAFFVVMDSVGIGGAPDADRFFNGTRPDTGANTLAHIAQACAAGRADSGRCGPLHLPNLDSLGVGAAIQLASGDYAPGLGAPPVGLWGAATEVSPGKDTPSGHWELAGLPVPWDWHYFPDTQPAFPDHVARAAAQAAGTDLAGTKPEDAYDVSVGLGSTMTGNDILDGYMRITVRVAISRPAEFIVITFQQKMQTS